VLANLIALKKSFNSRKKRFEAKLTTPIMYGVNFLENVALQFVIIR